MENPAVQMSTALGLAALLGLAFGEAGRPPRSPADSAAAEARFDKMRRDMVEQQIAARGVRDPRVLSAMARVPRHDFVPASERLAAYEDRPLPIGSGQTISQPYIVALMSEALGLAPGDTVLEIGTGSGYQAAVLSELASQVYSIEIVPELAERARETLVRLGCRNVEVRNGDGYQGWPEAALFDAIMVTAAPEHIPPPLLQQLEVGGRLVLPVGKDEVQELWRIVRTETGYDRQALAAVRFVPMTGQAQKER